QVKEIQAQPRRTPVRPPRPQPDLGRPGQARAPGHPASAFPLAPPVSVRLRARPESDLRWQVRSVRARYLRGGLPELCFSLLGPSLPLPGTVGCDEDVGRDVFGDGAEADEVSAAFADCWAGSLSKSMMLTAPAAMAAVAAILAIVTLRAEAPAATPVVLAAVPPPVANPLVLPPGAPVVVP